jgi:hypothetical protein
MVTVPVSTEPRDDRTLVFMKDEIQWADFQPNEFGLYTAISGPADVNLNCYPTWPGDDRIMSMKYNRANAATLGDVGFR